MSTALLNVFSTSLYITIYIKILIPAQTTTRSNKQQQVQQPATRRSSSQQKQFIFRCLPACRLAVFSIVDLEMERKEQLLHINLAINNNKLQFQTAPFRSQRIRKNELVYGVST
jgi:hypothetical protein